MAWKKTPPALLAAFDKAAPTDPRVGRRPVFGYPALLVNGNMFAGTFHDKVIARLAHDPPRGATAFEPMPGRRMKEYVVIPAATVRRPADLRRVLERALAHASALPPKPGRARAKVTKTTAAKRSLLKRSR
ncbi:MAG TPA: hypothetical protein VFM93_01150 [Candidatus Limnocylindria bacterium]|nr:hypothetical protein [Candidatus Limnocylindria bacterium]